MSDADPPSQLPAVLTGAEASASPEPPPRARPSADPGFAAQALGQNGQARGLKGGPPVLQAARKSYLQAQWSGPGDRRMPAGIIRKDEI